jgi:hypothetical protein
MARAAKAPPTKKSAGGYDEKAAARIRDVLADRADVVESACLADFASW